VANDVQSFGPDQILRSHGFESMSKLVPV
jgi:hypothetical protein